MSSEPISVIVLIAFADLGSLSVSPFGNSPSISALFFIVIFVTWSVIGAYAMLDARMVVRRF